MGSFHKDGKPQKEKKKKTFTKDFPFVLLKNDIFDGFRKKYKVLSVFHSNTGDLKERLETLLLLTQLRLNCHPLALNTCVGADFESDRDSV